MARISALHKKLRRAVGKALYEYQMIADGDRIAVGLSGGKDSLTLLYLLQERIAWAPVDYSLHPIYIDPGFENSFSDQLSEHCQTLGLTLQVEKTDFGPVAHSDINRENPCFLCARHRRQRMFEVAEKMNCRKVALGHHKDDLIETLFINMCYAGEISTMLPAQTLFKGAITLIRPLAYADEERIGQFAKQAAFPKFVNSCPSANNSKRQEIKELLNGLYRSNRKIKGNLFRAMRHVNLEYLPK